MPLRLRLVIAREGDVLTIRFGPRRSTSLSAGISVWLALLFLLSAEATSVLWAGGFGVLIWSYFGILLLLMWTFGLRILFWNLRFTTRIVISLRIIMVYKGICRQRKTLECELTPLMWFWLGIPAPPGFRAYYEFLGMGTWAPIRRSCPYSVCTNIPDSCSRHGSGFGPHCETLSLAGPPPSGRRRIS